MLPESVENAGVKIPTGGELGAQIDGVESEGLARFLRHDWHKHPLVEAIDRPAKVGCGSTAPFGEVIGLLCRS